MSKACALILFLISGLTWAQDFDAVLPKSTEVYFKTTDTEFIRGNITTPASLAKLWTAYLALNSSIEPRTDVSWKATASDPNSAYDVVLNSKGLPELNLVELVQQFHSQGIRRIVGDITIRSDISIVKPRDMSEASDSGYCYNAKTNAVNFNKNCVTIEIQGETARILDPDLKAPVRLNLTMNASYNGTRPHFRWLNKEQTQFEYVIDVWLKNPQSHTSVDVVVPDTIEWMQNKLVRLLGEQGVQFAAAPEFSTDAFENKTFIVPGRPILEDMCVALNESVNVYAESIFNLVPQAVRTGHKQHFSNIEIVEGAGMSRANKMPGEAVFQLLQAFTKPAYFEVMLNCLPVSGKSGTLKDRLGSVKGRAIAKTGSLNGLSHLGGFYEKQGQWLPFVFMLKDDSLRVAELRALQDRLLTEYLMSH